MNKQNKKIKNKSQLIQTPSYNDHIPPITVPPPLSLSPSFWEDEGRGDEDEEDEQGGGDGGGGSYFLRRVNLQEPCALPGRADVRAASSARRC